jgi:hypothetical protein
MKKTIVLTLSLALTISMLSACGGSAESEDKAKADTAKTVSAETTLPDTTTDSIEIDTDDQEDQNVSVNIETDTTSKAELSGQELIDFFQLMWDQVTVDSSTGIEDELQCLNVLATLYGYNLPSDVEERYIDWRPVEADSTDVNSSNNSNNNISIPKTSLFTSVNETVYATSTVNIRASYSTSSDKLGSLSQGSSITRTGIGTGEAEGWSQVNYNGKTCYIKSNFLSTTKPTVNSQNSSTSGSSTNYSNQNSGSGSSSSGSTPIVNGFEFDNGEIGEYVDPSGLEAGHNMGTGFYGDD